MPSPTTWKKHTSLLLSRLRSKRAATGGSSLVVQAGFPTSLADLFVKNHKKILPNKKPSSKHNGPVNQNPNPIPQPPVAVAGAVRYPGRTAEIDRSTSSSRSRRLGLGLGFLVVGLLAVGKKWVVVGFTILSLVLLVVELFGLVEKKKKPPPGTDEDRADVGVVDLTGRGLVSPIREASLCSDSESDIFSERSEISAEKRDFDGDRSSGSDVFLERRESLGEESDVSAERRDIDDDRGLKNSTKKRRKKKLFGKLFRRKCSRKKGRKGREMPMFGRQWREGRRNC
ncbi:Uncharacterized protein M6B38_221095 [Iris pallida]|uniref:Transmembrane protein n=1 Tax=Iris pallida TaxID=29817 RepID=A0AAX6DYU8_IRIPA|nr:Uncharacterized protein M6B38_221095 [Iris pallida]